MKREKTDSHYSDFLYNEDFILWHLTKEEDLNQYWKEYLLQHPEQKDLFQEAINHFDNVGFSNNKLEEKDRDKLLADIKSSSSAIIKRKQINRFFYYSAAACVLLLIGLSYTFKSGIINTKEEPGSSNVIVGQELGNQDIQLVTASGTTLFEKDLDVYVNNQGDVVVNQAEKDTTIVMKTNQDVVNRLVVPFGKRSRIVLADGSKLWLNSGSVLEFPSVFNGQTRDINLTGEMYIEVVRDESKPFLVHTRDLDIKVYGTEFNVSAYNDVPESIVLVKGSVGVKANQNKEIFLQPNERLLYEDNLLKKEHVNVSPYISWKDGYLIFNNTTIREVLKQVEKYYNVSFNLSNKVNLDTRTCTGKIYLSPNLTDVLNTISILSSTTYTIEDNLIYINL